jgi:hypothetical protein
MYIFGDSQVVCMLHDVCIFRDMYGQGVQGVTGGGGGGV